MSYQSIVHQVMIATPSDVPDERDIVRSVIHEWNAINSKRERRVLIPVSWETNSFPEQGGRPQELLNKQILKDSDLVVAVFWTRLGTPTGKAESGTVEEIREHIDAGKPALIYFSSKPTNPSTLDPLEYARLTDFKISMKNQGIIETFSNLEDFQRLFSRQLSQIVIDQFSEFNVTVDVPVDSAKNNLSKIQKLLSEEAKLLLIGASKDRNGYIISTLTSNGLGIQTNGKNYVNSKDPRTGAIWESALEELIQYDLVIVVGEKGGIFKITRIGYDVADQLLA